MKALDIMLSLHYCFEVSVEVSDMPSTLIYSDK